MSHAKHHADLIMCRRQPGTHFGYLCHVCEGRCVLCDSYIRPAAPVRLCSSCYFTSFNAASRPSVSSTTPSHTSHNVNNPRCVICNAPDATSQAFYCKECVVMERDRDGCPKVVNMSSAKLDAWYERQKQRQGPRLLRDLEAEDQRAGSGLARQQ
jgi:PHD finger-like domain-containing protein 5A